jgi:hypothetical protein
MKPRILLAFAAALFAAHAHAQAPAPAGAGAGDARAASASAAPAEATIEGGRDIVVAVDNPILPPAPHAASNVLGYGGAQRYRNGQRAMSTIAELKRRHGLSEVAGWPIASLGVYCAVLRPAPGADADALLQSLAQDARVRIAEPLHEYDLYARPSAGVQHNDPYVGLQRGFAEIHAAAAQRVSQGRGVEVALVDTGVDVAHPDLKGRIRGTHNLVDDDAAGFSRDRHGTEIAGVIAAVGDNRQGIVGIAPQATLSVYKACWHAPGAGVARCNTFTLAKALAAVMDGNARIVNLSLGGPPDPLLEQLLEALLKQDRIVVAAMPPDGRVEGFPAATPGVLVARSGDDAPDPAPAGVVDAPGDDILTTQPNGRYDFASGSSLAAAHVSGIAALLLAISPGLDADAVQRILQRSSDDDKRLVDAAAAVAALPDVRTAESR